MADISERQDPRIIQDFLRSGFSRNLLPNPFSCLPILANKDPRLIILIYAVTFWVKMTLLTVLRTQFFERYQLSYWEFGLICIGPGVASGIGRLLTGLRSDVVEPPSRFAYLGLGQYLHRTYLLFITKVERSCENLLEKVLRNSQNRDFPIECDFPIQKTRRKGINFLIIVSALGTMGYGLALVTKMVSLMVTFQ